MSSSCVHYRLNSHRLVCDRQAFAGSTGGRHFESLIYRCFIYILYSALGFVNVEVLIYKTLTFRTTAN